MGFRRAGNALGAALALAALGSACSSERAPRSGAGPEIDLAEVMRRTHFAFAADGVAFRGGHATYAARIEADGALRVTPAGATTALEVVTVAPASVAPPRLVDGAVVIERGAIAERLENTARGVEQSWTVAARPSEPVAVRVRARGLERVAADADGARFFDRATGRAVRYGAATWIDAHGVRTPVPIAAEGDELVLRVDDGLLARTAYPATLDPTIGPEVTMDAPIPTSPTQVAQPLALPGPSGGFLLVWNDGAKVVVRRVSSAGAWVGPEVLPGLAAPSYQGLCAAWDAVDARWLVASGGSAVRLDASGAVLDATPITLPTSGSTCSAAFDGTKFVVVTSGPGVNAVYVSAAGAVLAPSPVAVETAFVTGAHVACGPSGGRCLVVQSAVYPQNGLRGTVLDATGAVVGTARFSVTSIASGAHDVTTDGTQFLVGFPSQSGGQSFVARVSAAGTTIDANAQLVASGTGNGNVDVEFDGTNFVALRSGGGTSARRFAPTGTFVDAAPVVIGTGDRNQASLAYSNGQALLAWNLSVGLDVTSWASRLSATFAQLDGALGFPIAPRNNAESVPDLASSASGELAVWVDARGSSYDAYAVRLSPSGAVLDPVATRVASDVDKVAVASNGTDYLVAFDRTTYDYYNPNPVYAVRVSGSTGAVLDAAPIPVPGGTASKPAVTFDGQSYVIAWTDGRFQTLRNDDIYAGRVSPAGVALDPQAIRVASTTYKERSPSIASDGKTSLVVWHSTPNDFDADVLAARISQAGEVLDPDGIAVTRAPYGQWEPDVTWSGKDYVVVWSDTRILNALDLYAGRITSAGQPLDGDGVRVAEGSGSFFLSPVHAPRVRSANDGATLFLAWRQATGTGRYALYGARLRRSPLEAIDATKIALVDDTNDPRGIALSGASPAKVLLAYDRLDPALSVRRVAARVVDVGEPAGTACSDGAGCSSGVCRDGMCCDRACDGLCEACVAGACTPVVHAPDPDSCAGALACSADGARACKRADGQVCAASSDCASGFCVDGVCCNTACDGACATCVDTPGTCTPRPAFASGRPSCAPNRCNGRDLTCATSCVTDDDCADGYGCDRETGQCLAGTVCSDARTARAASGARSDCAPYACRARDCLTRCESVTDCAFPAVCDEAHRCVLPDGGSDGGCSASGRPARSGPIALAALVLAGLARRRKRP